MERIKSKEPRMKKVDNQNNVSEFENFVFGGIKGDFRIDMEKAEKSREEFRTNSIIRDRRLMDEGEILIMSVKN